MKIAYIADTYHPDINGTVTYLDTTARRLIAMGHEVLMCVPDCKKQEKEIDKQLIAEGFKIARFPSIPLDLVTNIPIRVTVPLWGNIERKFKKVLDDFEPDLIHIHIDLYLARLGLHYGKKYNIPAIMTAHTQMYTQWDQQTPKWMPRFLLKALFITLIKPLYSEQMDKIIAVGDDMDQYLKEMHGFSGLSLEVCTTGIDGTAFTPVDAEKERQTSLLFSQFPRLRDRKRLLYAGRISMDKNIDFLLNALQVLVTKRQDVELMIAGNGRLVPHYVKKIKRMGLSDYVTFIGTIEHSQMTKVYAITDVFTFASKSETQGLSTTEAIYFGVPSVVVAAQGSNTVLKGDRGGFLVPEETHIFADKVDDLLSDEKLYARKRAEALARHNELSFDHTMEQLMDIYSRVMENHHEKSFRSARLVSQVGHQMLEA